MDPDVTTTPRGALTSEFWLTVLGVAALVALVVTGDVDGTWAAGAIAFACFGYTASRAAVKRAQVGGDAQVASLKADLATLATAPADQVDPGPGPARSRARKAG